MSNKVYLNWIFILSALVVFICFSCKENEPQKIEHKKDSTTEMVAELQQIATQSADIQMWHQNKTKALAYDRKLQSVNDHGQKMSLLFQSGIEWLNAGDYTTSIERFNSIFQYLRTNQLTVPKEVMKTFREMLGMAYLRKAEIENCIQNHNEYSCILPIEQAGQHNNRAGSEAALKVFENILREYPNDVQVKWLYNITKMTLGQYPQQVEADFLISPSIFESETHFPRMTDMAMNLGVAVNDISGGIIMDDFNNDHYLDLMVSSYGLDDQLRYFQNNKKGGFDDLTISANLKGLWGGLNMIQADYNNDGWLDILILRGAWLGNQGTHPNSLLRNNGDNTFTDVTKETGLYCHFPTQAASWADFNNDGWIDLFIANESSESVDAPCQLFQNNGDGTFRDVATEKGLAIKDFIKGCVWGDYNNDGLSDLYLSSISGPNYLMKNGGTKTNFIFKNVASQAKTTAPIKSFPCWFFDYNQDGWEDIFVSGFDFSQFGIAASEVAKDYLNQSVTATLPKLYQNNQDGTFSDITQKTNIDKVLYTMGCNFGDLNNDGFPDFYAATGTPDFRALIPNRMFLNNEGNEFFDITKSAGLGHLQKGHGVAFGDIDMDGDQDIYHVLGGSYDGDNFMNALFVNAENQNNWIKLKLQGSTANKAAIGAKVKILAIKDNGESRVFYSRVNSGGSFGANPLQIEQGLGAFNKIKQIEIIWPGQQRPQIVDRVRSNAYYTITQGEESPQKIELQSVTLKGKHIHKH